MLRELLWCDDDIDRYIADPSRTGVLTASLNWSLANLALRRPGSPPALPPVNTPTFVVWPTNDHDLDGEHVKALDRFHERSWR